MSEPDRHLDLLQLDALRSGDPGEPAHAAHAATCPQCQTALDELIALADGLKLLHGPARQPAPSRDERVLELARARAAQVRGRSAALPLHWPTRRAVWAVAALALLALASWALATRRHQTSDARRLAQVAPAPPVAPAASASIADLDRDGRVTVLDAFALARAIEAGRQDPALDVNRDGRVDEDDVNAVLALAVSVRDN
jgi:hypothetical protein